MRTIIVDDEAVQLEEFRYVSEDVAAIELVGCFDSPPEALEFVRQNTVELAFLDIRMPEMDGFVLAKQLRLLNPQMKIIALTASDKHGSLAKIMDGILLKPYEERDLEKAVAALTEKGG